MNANQDPGNDPLDHVLRDWTVSSSLPPRFQEQVWTRITRAESQVQPTLWAALSRWLGDVLPRPEVAAAYLSVILALGAGAGAFAAQSKNSRLDAQLSLRYVQSIDPYYAVNLVP
jgi:hypothetical protein